MPRTQGPRRTVQLTEAGMDLTDRMLGRRHRRAVPVLDVVHVPVRNLPPYKGDLSPRRAAS